MPSIQRVIKILIGLKLFIVIGILAHMKGYLSFGDKSLTAQEKGEEEQEFHQAERKKVVKKTYLDELFKLPEINPDAIKKEEVGQYLSLLEKKRQQLEDRLKLLQEREAKLIEIDRSINNKMEKLDEERRFFLETIQKEKVLSEDRTKQLVDYYKKMKPKKASAVFEKLDKDLVVTMFNMMPEKQIMSILEVMDPDKSVELTEYYGRVRSGREYDLLKEMNATLQKEFKECH